MTEETRKTRPLSRVPHLRSHARAGRVMVILPTAGPDDHVAFGPRGEGRYTDIFTGDSA
ncbi:hypothetical protein [Marivita sp.]|uniref:hypothetical protein n=1 Tax=Marivita sp. TaxID=2003365 RepID=UPI0025B932D2|nr:hypothetical protein [Marivita sp.]